MAVVLATTMTVGLLAGCGGSGSSGGDDSAGSDGGSKGDIVQVKKITIGSDILITV